MSNKLIALAGQPNCGKSTIFNMLTGARQYVANYPGVTVEKNGGTFTLNGQKISLVDLPGTYAFTSYSPEEKAARDFILNEQPDVVINVVDASSLDKGLYFVLQLLEMGRPVILALNMMDVATRRGVMIDVDLLSEKLGIPVVPLSATSSKSEGKTQLLELVERYTQNPVQAQNFTLDYGPLEEHIGDMADHLEDVAEERAYPKRWLAIKIYEEDAAVVDFIRETGSCLRNIDSTIGEHRALAEASLPSTPPTFIAAKRHELARSISQAVLHIEKLDGTVRKSFTEKVDSIACNRFMGPIILFAVLFAFYNISVTYGNVLAAKVWPVWGSLETFTSSYLPHQGFLEDPILRSLVEWVVKSITAVLNYIPIFVLMFSFVSILEDSGYMSRIAFILDKLFYSYGLHGQSTLPLILAGVYVGGCAIPGVVATKAIPDERARFTTILIVPMMNCLAKVPLYLLLVSGFFAAEAGSTMFFMGTITLLMALIVAKVLNLTLLKGRPSAPYIIELPAYHMPIARHVFQKTLLRVWIFIKKILTIVIAVSTVVFALISFPNLSEERIAYYNGEQEKLEESFMQAVSLTSFAGKFSNDDILPLIRYQDELRLKKRGVSQDEAKAINEAALKDAPVYASIVLRRGKDGKKLASALRTLDSKRKNLRREIRQERFEHSYLGRLGKVLEPVTAGAGFDWRMNIALLSALAAKENSAATLGALYGFEGGKPGDNFEKYGFTPLHALALMLFMSLYPPCLPASMMVRGQTGSTNWMVFSIVFQMTIGLLVATLVFSGGTMFKLSGVEAMWAFYAFCFVLAALLGLIPTRDTHRESRAR